jgi:hypothetical protein
MCRQRTQIVVVPEAYVIHRVAAVERLLREVDRLKVHLENSIADHPDCFGSCASPARSVPPFLPQPDGRRTFDSLVIVGQRVLSPICIARYPT